MNQFERDREKWRREEAIRQATRAYLKSLRVTLYSQFFQITSDAGREEAIEWLTTQIILVLDHVERD